jgi:hypothetical protein
VHSLLQLIQVLLQNWRIFKAVNEVGKVSNVFCEGGNTIGVYFLDFVGEWKGLIGC